MGQRCGIWTYASRLAHYLSKIKDVEVIVFAEKIRKFSPDVISIQYEPGLMQPQVLQQFVQKYTQPIVVTAHHIGHLQQFYPILDGIILHSKTQIPADKDGKLQEPWNYTVIPHPALVFPEKGKDAMKEKYGLPKDKKVIGTMGFIAGTGKELQHLVPHILQDLKDDEFLYLATSFWKGGDFGFEEQILNAVKKLGKEKQFKLDSDFVSEEVLNEKMQACDLLFAWNQFEAAGSTSGIAMDMLGSRRKLIVKDSPHYALPASLKGVLKGRWGQEDFAKDVLKALRTEDLNDVPDPTPYSWETLTEKYLDFFKQRAGI
jgi:hypothetical protein